MTQLLINKYMDKHNTSLIDILYAELEEIDAQIKRTNNESIIKTLHERRKELVNEIVNYKLQQYEWRKHRDV